MISRPVLAMNFYRSETGHLISPFERMKIAAEQQKKQRQTSKKEIVVETFHQIQEVVNNFIPQPTIQLGAQSRRNKSGPYTYDKTYFQKLDRNIKLINNYLQTLEHQTSFGQM